MTGGRGRGEDAPGPAAMPANLSPEYKDAQEAFRRARETPEKLECLRVMLRTIPKHKGTEHLQAEIKTRIKELTDELGGPKKGAVRGGPDLTVRHEGAAQVALVGPPNAGKSSLHARLTGSHAVVGPYPFSTKHPLPGMLLHEDVQIQVVDLPPVAEDHMEPWMSGTLHNADAVALVVDLSDPACVDQLDAVERRLAEKKVILVPRLGAPAPGRAGRRRGGRRPRPLPRPPARDPPREQGRPLRGPGRRARGLPGDRARPVRLAGGVGRDRRRPRRGRARPLLAARDRPRLPEGARPPARPGPAVRPARRRDRARRGPAGPPRHGGGAAVRAGVGPERGVRRPAGERRPRREGPRRRRAALVGYRFHRFPEPRSLGGPCALAPLLH